MQFEDGLNKTEELEPHESHCSYTYLTFSYFILVHRLLARDFGKLKLSSVSVRLKCFAGRIFKQIT